jgi:hypothetical protein
MLALTAEGKVLIEKDGRLQIRAVRAVRQQNGQAILKLPIGQPPNGRAWLKPGDRLITSAVLAPIEGQTVRERVAKPEAE